MTNVRGCFRLQLIGHARLPGALHGPPFLAKRDTRGVSVSAIESLIHRDKSALKEYLLRLREKDEI